MRRLVTWVCAVMTAGTAVSAFGTSWAGAAGGAAGAAARWTAGSRTLPAPGARLWVQRYEGATASGVDKAVSVAAAPGGSRVFVTGSSYGPGTRQDYVTVAYNAATGARLWTERYNSTDNGNDYARSVTVSPDGATVFVTGNGYTAIATGYDFTTVAYNAATGAQLWVARYNGPGSRDDLAASVAVSPRGGTVFVTGTSFGTRSGRDYATVAYNAATGARLWAARYNGPADRDDSAFALAVSPRGGRVFVTGSSDAARNGDYGDYATVAYSTATGARLWVRRYGGPGAVRDAATSVALSPHADAVYVTGWSGGASSDYATIAYKAVTGARLWIRRYSGSRAADAASALAVSPGGTVLVTGTIAMNTANSQFATVAYSAAGARLWVRRYSGPGGGTDTAYSVTAPGNGNVYVTGRSWGGSATRYDYATIAYNVFTGAQLWARRYNGPPSSGDYARSVTARGNRVFVTGASYGTGSGQDYATIAYSG